MAPRVDRRFTAAGIFAATVTLPRGRGGREEPRAGINPRDSHEEVL